MRKTVISIIAFSLALLLMGSMSYAQRRTGSIKGTVTDPEGGALPGVTVTLSGEKLMGGTHSIITNEEGKFRFPSLMPGEYEITASLEGFKTTKRTRLKVSIGRTVTVDVILEPATLEENVTVLAEAPVIDVQKSEISTNIDSELMEIMPMRRFSFFDFVGTTPGITTSSGSHSEGWHSALGSIETVADHVVDEQDSGCVADMLGICRFAYFAFSENELSRIYSGFTGVDLSPDDLKKAAKRVIQKEREFNLLAGIDPSQDTLPARFFEEKIPIAGQKRNIDREAQFNHMLAKYYEIRGWKK